MKITWSRIAVLRTYEGPDIMFGAHDIVNAMDMFDDCNIKDKGNVDEDMYIHRDNIYFNLDDINKLDSYKIYSVNEKNIVADNMRTAVNYYISLMNDKSDVGNTAASDVRDVKLYSNIYMCPIRTLK